MEQLGLNRETVHQTVLAEPFHDISVSYHLLNDRFCRKLSTETLYIPTTPIPISQHSSRRSSILTGVVVRDDQTPSRRSSSSPTTTQSSSGRRASLPPTMSVPAKLLQSCTWPTDNQQTFHLGRGIRRASDGAIPSPQMQLSDSQKPFPRGRSIQSTSDTSLSKELATLSMDELSDEDLEPDMEAVQRYLMVRGKATRHTVGTAGKRASTTQNQAAYFASSVLPGGPRRHSDNPGSGSSSKAKASRMAYFPRPISPMDEMSNLQRQLDSGFGSPSSYYSHSPAILSPLRQSLSSGNGPSSNMLTVPNGGTFPARLNAAFSSPTFLDKLYGGIRIRVTAEDESSLLTGQGRP